MLFMWKGEAVPQLILGTVQLGMPYGIANTVGQPDLVHAREIVETALSCGIRHFDTAQAYGDSERVLGEALADLGASATACLSSKLSANLDPLDPTQLSASIEASLKRLRVDQLWCMMLHRPAWLAHWDGALGETLCRYRDAGRIQHLGVSLSTFADAAPVFDNPDVEIVQVPCNAWDRRAAEQGLLENLRASGRLACVRSIYLQGLLTLPPEAAAAKLPQAREASLRWNHLAQQIQHAPAALAMRYARTLNTPLVVGAESKAQVADTARLASLPPLTPADIQLVRAIVDPHLTETILEPPRWS
ncbi:MAG: aldo/keto reductase [Candidatus Hydrogenedentes bacterium]|nr:aldo/keto reductase [Candidatus Hydrogenedentota bacterium]